MTHPFLLRKEERYMKRLLNKMSGKISEKIYPKWSKAKIAVLIIIGVLSYVQPVYAADAVTAKINNIYTLVVGIIGALGAIILAWGVFEFATAYQHHDSSQQTMALKKVVAGILCCSASALIALLK